MIGVSWRVSRVLDGKSARERSDWRSINRTPPGMMNEDKTSSIGQGTNVGGCHNERKIRLAGIAFGSRELREAQNRNGNVRWPTKTTRGYEGCISPRPHRLDVIIIMRAKRVAITFDNYQAYQSCHPSSKVSQKSEVSELSGFLGLVDCLITDSTELQIAWNVNSLWKSAWTSYRRG